MSAAFDEADGKTLLAGTNRVCRTSGRPELDSGTTLTWCLAGFVLRQPMFSALLPSKTFGLVDDVRERQQASAAHAAGLAVAPEAAKGTSWRQQAATGGDWLCSTRLVKRSAAESTASLAAPHRNSHSHTMNGVYRGGAKFARAARPCVCDLLGGEERFLHFCNLLIC